MRPAHMEDGGVGGTHTDSGKGLEITIPHSLWETNFLTCLNLYTLPAAGDEMR